MAPSKLTPSRPASSKEAPVRSAPAKFALERSALKKDVEARLAPWKLAFAPWMPRNSFPESFCPEKSCVHGGVRTSSALKGGAAVLRGGCAELQATHPALELLARKVLPTATDCNSHVRR